MLSFWTQLAVVLTGILLGVRRGGVALGLIGGLGVTTLVFGFRATPSEPPILVMLIILAVTTASAAMQVAGGLDFLVQMTEHALRKHPKWITILAPLATFFLTVLIGTGHAVYALLPVIADVSLKTKIRPERPMAMSSVASQMGITASPVAAVIAIFMEYANKAGTPIGLFDVMKVTLPAGLAGVFVASIWSLNRGLDLDKDPEFQKRLKDPKFHKELGSSVTTLNKKLPKTAKLSVVLFFLGVGVIILLALFPQLLPVVNQKPLQLTTVVQLIMLSFGALSIFANDIKSADIARSSVFTAGMVAVVSIFGIAWMSDTFVSGNKDFLLEKMESLVKAAPWTFGLVMFAVSALVKSQAAALTVMIPFAKALGMPTTLLLAVLPSSYAYFFFAFYPSDLAAINMDRTGTTRIGKYLLNHSFMVPGLIGVGVATFVSYFLAQLAFS